MRMSESLPVNDVLWTISDKRIIRGNEPIKRPEGFQFNTEYPITPGQIERFRRDGHIKLPDVFDRNTIAEIRSVVSPLMSRQARLLQSRETGDVYRKAFVASGKLWQQDETGLIYELASGLRLAKIAADLFEARGVGLWQDQGIYKEPGSIGTPEHRDQYYWPTDGKVGTLWIALDDIPPERGALTFRSGSNYIKSKQRDGVEISEDSDRYFSNHPNTKDIPSIPTDYQMGDVTFHDSLVVHGTGPNRTGATRMALAISYYDIDASLVDPKRVNQNDMYDKLTGYGIKTGDHFISPHTPLVYVRPGANIDDYMSHR